MKIFKNSIIFLLLLFSINIAAQNNTNSPYTRFGYGKLVDGGFGRTSAMGGIGFGFRQKNAINAANPAAYSSIDSTSFLFEFGFSGLLTSFSTTTSNTYKIAGNIDYFALQFPVTKWLGMSAGIIPYSFAGYNFSTKDSMIIPSKNDSVWLKNYQSFSGSGAISQVYLGLSVDLFKHLSLGINGYYIFGSVHNYRYYEPSFSDNRPFVATSSDDELKVSSFNARFGLQYRQAVNKKRDMLTIGAIYEFQHKLNSDFTQTKTGLDTLTNSLKNAFDLPNVYGLGFTYLLNNKILFGADFMYQQFAKAKFQQHTDTLNNRMKISAGIEYIHKPNSMKYIDRMIWRLGANYSNSYIKVNNKSTSDFAITAGIGFPFRTIKSILNIYMEYGKFGTTNFDMIKENYFRLGINFTLNENWFFKAKIQ